MLITQCSFYNFLEKSPPPHPESISKAWLPLLSLAVRKLKVKFVRVWQLCGAANCLISVITWYFAMTCSILFVRIKARDSWIQQIFIELFVCWLLYQVPWIQRCANRWDSWETRPRKRINLLQDVKDLDSEKAWFIYIAF